MSTKPIDDLGFERVASLESLAGCYENRAHVGKGVGLMFLSSIIWPDSKLPHGDITAVEVRSLMDDKVSVSAHTSNGVIKEQVFASGRDFTFESGQVRLTRPFGSAASESGNVFIGVGTQTKKLGIDSDGNGRAVSSASFAGTAFLVIPIAGGVSDVGRFTRNRALCVQHGQ
ncbi:MULTISPECIES: hypothetical protein [Rubrivivax]|uniref:Uncharacterized protein n=1 Tax=Rubrivivax benzoatilyticus TaxID=316997 RepID=A0ABX0HU44_9BURK|nr:MULTISPECIES: hypothetical protein [Rubrivivax]NHK96870.1 hypothetical protein [Rubrivivax benzoatilyticus]NHL24585.1 hypothetical protein [Rubrivivax benzoatilyticus]